MRQAIEELARKQIVVRKQGKGTFVTAAGREARPAPAARPARLAVLAVRRREHGTAALRTRHAAARHCRGAEPATRDSRRSALDRLYLIGGRPVALAQAWLAPEVAALPRAKAELISTEDMMRAAGIRIATSQVSIRAEAAGTVVGRLLALPARAPVLVLRRNALSTDGVAKEASRVWFCSDAYELVCTERSVENVFRHSSVRTCGEHT